MQILNVSPEELDYVAMLCVDPGLPPRWRQEMASAMDTRKRMAEIYDAKRASSVGCS